MVCGVLYFLSKIIFWRAESFGMFLLERLLLSVVLAGLSGVDSGLLYLSCGPENAQRVFGWYDALGTAGLLAASGVYSLWVGGDYRLAGFLTVCSYGLAALLALGLRDVKPPLREKGAAVREFRAIGRDTLRDPRLLAFLLGTAALSEVHQTVTVFLSQLQYVRCGLADRTIGLLFGAVTLAGLSGGLSARFTRRWGRRRGGAALFTGAAGACALLALTRSAALSAGAILLLRVCFSLAQPLQADLANRWVRSGSRATALSFYALLSDGPAIGVNLLLGSAAERDLPLAMALGGGLCLAGLGLYLCGVRGVPRNGRTESALPFP